MAAEKTLKPLLDHGLNDEWADWLCQCVSDRVDPEWLKSEMSANGFSDAAVTAAFRSVIHLASRKAPALRVDPGATKTRTGAGKVTVGFSSQSPRLILLPRLVPAEECDKIAYEAASFFLEGQQPCSRGALVARIPSSATSELAALRDRLCAVAGMPSENLPFFEVARIGSGEAWEPLPWAKPEWRLGRRPRAMFTLFLSVAPSGGCALIEPSVLSFSPAKGTALYADFESDSDPDAFDGASASVGTVDDGEQWVLRAVLLEAPIPL